MGQYSSHRALVNSHGRVVIKEQGCLLPSFSGFLSSHVVTLSSMPSHCDAIHHEALSTAMMMWYYTLERIVYELKNLFS